MGFGAGGTRSSRALTRRCTTRAPPGRSPKRELVPAVLRFLKRTQNRHTREPGVRGGIKGSWPVGGDYGAYEVLNWATKFFADALMRHEAVETHDLGATSPVSVLA